MEYIKYTTDAHKEGARLLKEVQSDWMWELTDAHKGLPYYIERA